MIMFFVISSVVYWFLVDLEREALREKYRQLSGQEK